MHFVYATYNKKNDKIYIGESSNVERRVEEHNQKKGNHFTAKFEGDWVLIQKESLITRSEAIKREIQLKSHQGRAYLKQFTPSTTE